MADARATVEEWAAQAATWAATAAGAVRSGEAAEARGDHPAAVAFRADAERACVASEEAIRAIRDRLA